MLLFERIYEIAQKTFWHGSTSPKPLEKLEARTRYLEGGVMKPGPPVLFVSYDHHFAVKFAASENIAVKFVASKNEPPSAKFYVYELRFTRDPNIFNATTGHDIQRLIKYLTTKWGNDLTEFHNEFDTDPSSTIEDYVKTLRFREWDSVENGALLFTLIKMGYDGFATLERRKNHLGLFNADLVKIVGREEFYVSKDGIYQEDEDGLVNVSASLDGLVKRTKDTLDNRINTRGEKQHFETVRTLRTDRENAEANRFKTRDMNSELR
jgi:hypothetical protein